MALLLNNWTTTTWEGKNDNEVQASSSLGKGQQEGELVAPTLPLKQEECDFLMETLEAVLVGHPCP